MITDEDGYEAKLRKLSVGRYSMLNVGDMVFDKEATEVLWEFAKILKTLLTKFLSFSNLSTNAYN